MGFDEVCDFFEEKGCGCKECACAGIEDAILEEAYKRGLAVWNEYFKQPKTCYSCKYASKCDSEEFVRCEVLRYEPVKSAQAACKMYEEQPYDNDKDGYDVESPEEFLAEDIDEATTKVVENLVFLGEGTTSKDVMIAILGLEATIASIKQFLLENE